MGQALYRKYRSKTLDEVVGQEHVTRTLSNALKTGAISHAYLLTGPKGVGKTSVARILAHEINQLDYDESLNHLDIIEIDAASNRRIDEIRDLRDKVHIAPTSAKYKVYIIDEVHMLTKESFNALLKTLEEPPAHVVFILATTEAHKLPDTIISRTQHFNFKPIDEKLNAEHLQRISKNESIDIDFEALELIAKHGSGSFRDSISLLDQLSSTNTEKIVVQDVQKALGIAPDELITKITSAIFDNRIDTLIEVLEVARVSGYSSAKIATQLSMLLRHKLLTSSETRRADFKLLKDLVAVPASDNPDTLLEIILLEALFNNVKSVNTADDRGTETLPEVEEVALKKVIATEEPKVRETDNATETETDNSDLWMRILDSLKSKHNTLYSIARMAKCQINGTTISLSFDFPFHYKRIMEPKNKAILEETANVVLGKKCELICELNSKIQTKSSEDSTDIKAISNIFGDVEVLES